MRLSSSSWMICNQSNNKKKYYNEKKISQPANIRDLNHYRCLFTSTDTRYAIATGEIIFLTLASMKSKTVEELFYTLLNHMNSPLICCMANSKYDHNYNPQSTFHKRELQDKSHYTLIQIPGSCYVATQKKKNEYVAVMTAQVNKLVLLLLQGN